MRAHARVFGTFDPVTASIAGLTQDLWASEGVTEAAGAVSAWTERSNAAGSSDATQGTGANQPTYNATAINGRPGIDFASGKYLSMAMSVASGDWTMFFVVNPSATAAGGGLGSFLMHWETGNGAACMLTSTDKVGYFSGGSFRGTNAGTLGPQVLTLRLNSAGADVRRDGVNLDTGLVYTAFALGGVTQRVGANISDTSPLLGSLGRAVIYAGNLTTAEVQEIERGLGAYYAINVA